MRFLYLELVVPCRSRQLLFKTLNGMPVAKRDSRVTSKHKKKDKDNYLEHCNAFYAKIFCDSTPTLV